MNILEYGVKPDWKIEYQLPIKYLYKLMATIFASLHNHSNYSLLDATMSPEFVVEQAKSLGFQSVAISEHGNMYSVIDGYKKAKELGINYIPACEVYETTDMKWKESESDRYHLLLLAKSEQGYKNLNKIVTESHLRGFYGKPRVDLETIAQNSEGIIASSACLASRLMRLLVKGFCPCCGLGNNEHKDACDEESTFEPRWEEAKAEVERYKQVFGDDFYIELQTHATPDQETGNKRILELAKMTDTKTILTFDAHMKDGSEKTRDIHRKFVEIAQSGREVGETYQDCYQMDMETIFNMMVPQIGFDETIKAIFGTAEIARKCDVEIELGQDLMPHVEVPKRFKTETDYLKHLVNVGWKERGVNKFAKWEQKRYKERLKNELEVLEYLGYQGYFLMLKKIIDGVKEREIPYGYSRGSGGNCLTLWILGVTEIDSIRWDLDFSRFANKGRKGSAADYDLDISKRKRPQVLEMTDEMFGHDNVAHLCTFNSLSPKVCIRDLGKVFDSKGIYNIPYKTRDKVSKLVPDGATIEEALQSSVELRKWEKKYPLLFEYSKALQNMPKSVGTHASAIIIANNPLVEYGALMSNKDGRPTLQLEMGNAEDDIGLVKMDYLGLISLDTVDDTLALSGLTWDDIDLQKLDLDDKKVFSDIYATGETLGIFQMESSTAQSLFRDIRPDYIEDVFAVNAMNRPAVLTVGKHNHYINNKHNPEDIEYLHTDLEPIMNKTNGVMIYQEQALSVFAVSGFPESRRDVARRAIGKKKEKVMKTLFKDFTEGLKERGWNQEQIDEMWELIKAQAEYSFNRGHSVAYGLLSYVTAYLKHYYPTEFMTALLISEIGDYEQTSKYISSCDDMGIKVVAPHINKSERHYTTKKKGEILFGFESIKGVGAKAVDVILEERSKGKFKSLKDFFERTSLDKTTIISLIKAGAFGQKKEKMLEGYSKLTFVPNKHKEVKTLPTKRKLYEYGIIKTDEEFKDKEKCLKRYNLYRLNNHKKKMKTKQEKHLETFREKYMQNEEMYEFETLSIFLNGSPFDEYTEFINSFDEYEDEEHKILLGGTIVSIERKKQKNGGTFAYINLLTVKDGIIEGMIFNDNFNEYNDLIYKGSNIVILCKKSGTQFIVDKVKPLDSWKKHIDSRKSKKEIKAS